MTLRNEMGRILITGAGGRVATVYRLAVAGRHALRLAERDTARLTDIGAHDEIVACDVRDLQACRRACDGIDTVLHLAADPRPTPISAARSKTTIS
ncbi:hopanoid-associated sugar epimerase [Serratia rubidaea]|uniref:Hopanoid-associated sugar epimerase n=1 Tax=Serratia rubidaea TaxID=61652 RepID=A0A4V6JGD7_SERRU|nr:hopanoid-associated sugar epimerase [Serratia rubidaea]